VARAVERTAGHEFCVTRLTVELMRPVPLDRLALDIAVPRPGRRVLGITVSVSAGDLEVEVVRAHAVAIRRADLPTGEGHESHLEPGPEAGVVLPFGFEQDDRPAFHRSGVDDWIFLNPDLTLHLARPPEGEWIGLEAFTLPSDQGVAMAESAVYDDRGRLGRAVQSLLLQRRDR
jgi:hypothetical protein